MSKRRFDQVESIPDTPELTLPPAPELAPQRCAALPGVAAPCAAASVQEPQPSKRVPTIVLSSQVTRIVGLNRYENWEKIGEGTFGDVFRAFDRCTHACVAIKKLKEDSTSAGVSPLVLKEVAALRLLEHPNVVRLISVVHERRKVNLVFEHLDCNLHDYIKGVAKANQRIPLEDVKVIMRQMAEALEFAHSRGIIHRDLKPANVLLSKQPTLTVKLADFGQCSEKDPTQTKALTREVQTLWWRSPEVLMGLPNYTTAVDVWSLGCIFGHLITGHVLMKGDSEVGQLFEIFSMIGTPSDETWEGFSKLSEYNPLLPKFNGAGRWLQIADWPYHNEDGYRAMNLLQRMLTGNPKNRIAMAEVLKHDYFR